MALVSPFAAVALESQGIGSPFESKQRIQNATTLSDTTVLRVDVPTKFVTQRAELSLGVLVKI